MSIVLARIDPEALLCSGITALLCLVILAVIIVKAIISADKRKKLIAQSKREYREWRRKLEAIGELLPIQSSKNLIRGEDIFFEAPAALVEPRSIRSASYGGGAIRVAKGVHVGGGTSTSESHDEWRILSHGTLYITDKNIIFDGDMHDRTIGLSTLISAQSEPCHIAISSMKYKKTTVFMGLNGLIAGDIIKLLCNQE